MENYLIQLEKILTSYKYKFNGDVIPIPLVKGEKKPLYSHKTRTNADLWSKWRSMGVGMVLDGDADLGILIRNNAMIVVDFDNKDQPSIFEENIPEFKETVKQETKKGFHYFFKGTDETKSIFNQVRPFADGIDIDLITTHDNGTGGIITIYPSYNKTWINDITTTTMLPMPSKFVQFYNEKRESATKEKLVEAENNDEQQPSTPITYAVLEEIVMGIAPQRGDYYGGEYGWRNIAWAILNTARTNNYVKKGNDLLHKFSRQSVRYDEDKVETFIYNSKAPEDGTGYGVGTLLNILKQDNEILFNKVQLMLNPIKRVNMNGYSFINDDEPITDLYDGQQRDYVTMKEVFERNNFKVCDAKIRFVELLKQGSEDVEKVRTRTDLKDKCENLYYYFQVVKTDKKGNETIEIIQQNFFDRWIKDPTMRTYDAMEFLPPPTKADPKVFNLWKGFRAAKIDLQIPKEERVELLKPIYEHINIVCKRDVKAFTYIKKWVAQMLQQPSIKPGIALCFQSVEGTGKGTFICDFLAKGIIGEDYFWESRDCVNDLFSKHSIAFHRKVLVNIDEPSAYDLRNNHDKFKNLITSTKQRLENKGIDAKQVTTCERYMISTNNEDVLRLSSNDRRFVVIECSDELIENTDYFNTLHEYIKREDVQRAFYDDMMEEDIGYFDWKKERPMTDAYIKNLDACVAPHIRFMAGEVNQYEQVLPTYDVSGKELFKKFLNILGGCKSKYTCEYIAFTKMIGKLDGVVKDRNRYGLFFTIDTKKLKEHLTKKHNFLFDHYQFYEDIEESN